MADQTNLTLDGEVIQFLTDFNDQCWRQSSTPFGDTCFEIDRPSEDLITRAQVLRGRLVGYQDALSRLADATLGAAPGEGVPKVKRFSGPGEHMCWTQDSVPKSERVLVSIVKEADLRAVEARLASPSPARSDRGADRQGDGFLDAARTALSALSPFADRAAVPGTDIVSGSASATFDLSDCRAALAARQSLDAALAAAPTPPAPDGLAGRVPVAWRVRHGDKASWSYMEIDPGPSGGYWTEVEPLYSAASNGVVNAAQAILKEVTGFSGFSAVSVSTRRLRDLQATLDAALSDQPTPPMGVGVKGGPSLREVAILHAMRNVDRIDCEHVIRDMPDSGHGRFWKTVARDLIDALATPSEPLRVSGLKSRSRLSSTSTPDADRVEALRVAADDWRPIESAPKDGTPLLCVEYDEPQKVVDLHWYFDGTHGSWRGSFGQYRRPTHWMPLPAPPAALRTALGASGEEGAK